jgi:hypothetical protein
MRVHFFLDPVSGWTCWIPQGTAEADPQADKDQPAALQGPAGRSLAVRLLCRVGSWFGVGEQAPSRIPASRCDPWEPGTHRHRTVWSWWCR